MSRMSRDKAIDRVRKLRALATSSNPSEAAVAKKQADLMFKRHGLTEAELSLTHDKPTTTRGRRPAREASPTDGTTQSEQVFNAVADLFDLF